MMRGSDWLGGLALAAFFAPLVGMVGMLIASLGDRYNENRSDRLVSSLDLRRALVIGGVAFVTLIVPCAMLFKQDRVDAESWEQFIRDHRCAVVDSRTRTEFHYNPGLKMNQTTTVTEYLWRCDNGEYWRR